MTDKKMRLMPLFLPIFLELVFTMLAGVVDTLMLTAEGDVAVGSVGTANSYINVFLVLLTIISSGMLAVMTQYIGAKRPGVAQQTLRLGLAVNVGAGLFVTVLLCFFADPILAVVGIADDLREPAKVYMQTVGAFCICSALIPVYTSYLRAFGHTPTTLVASVAANISNVIMNAVFLYMLDMGVFGVALATGLSRLINALWVILASRRKVDVGPREKALRNRDILGKILRVGLPGALESLLYNLAMMIVISFLNRMDSTGTQAIVRAYAVQIGNFSFCAACGLAQANAILTGWRIGAGELDICDRETRKYAYLGMLFSGCITGFFAIFSRPILSLFVQDPHIAALVRIILFIEIPQEIGRAFNMVFGFSLKSSGDALYPMTIGLIFMFLCAVGGTWLFGVKLGWLAVGAYVGMALDECTRAVFMFLRWQKGIWKRRNLISTT